MVYRNMSLKSCKIWTVRILAGEKQNGATHEAVMQSRWWGQTRAHWNGA